MVHDIEMLQKFYAGFAEKVNRVTDCLPVGAARTEVNGPW